MAAKPLREAARRNVERNTGVGFAVMNFSAGRATNTRIADFNALPVAFVDVSMQSPQHSSGAFFALPNFSVAGGNDVPR